MAQAVPLCLAVVLCLVSLISGKGSTPHLKDIVLGRCWDFQVQKQHAVSAKNCSKIWELFYTAFAYKDPCDTTFADYKPYFDEVGMDIVLPNKSLFWSGTYKEAHVFSDFDSRYTTLEDTMAGWIVNGLTWCGDQSNSSDGINYSSCPSCDYFTPFWGQASSRFAAKASGIVRVMVNGTRVNNSGYPVPAYRKDSYFGQFELPNLRVEAITKLLILVVHSIDGPYLESCGNGSIEQLQNDARHRGINATCYDDPDDVEHLLCADHPMSRACLFFKNNMRKMTKTIHVSDCNVWKILGITMSAIVALCLIAAVVGIICKARLIKKCFTSSGYERHTL